jgi:hypothetical protein
MNEEMELSIEERNALLLIVDGALKNPISGGLKISSVSEHFKRKLMALHAPAEEGDSSDEETDEASE